MTCAQAVADIEVGLLINSAGMSYDHAEYFEAVSEADIAAIIQVNIVAVTRVSSATCSRIVPGACLPDLTSVCPRADVTRTTVTTSRHLYSAKVVWRTKEHSRLVSRGVSDTAFAKVLSLFGSAWLRY